MTPISFTHLDIPIIRSCNLACKGCITHSDHKKIKGTVKVDESLEWLKFWSERLKPSSVTVFGGEPLLHPEFTKWVTTVRGLWDYSTSVRINTNGYYLDTIYDDIPALFGANNSIMLIVSVQTGTDPYLSKVYSNIETLKQRIVDYHLSRTGAGIKTAEWRIMIDEYEVNYKRWYRFFINDHATPLIMAVCDQYKLTWMTHYGGHGEQMRTVYDYNAEWYVDNHKFCQAKDFVTLYRGKLWKCPPMGVLEHTLDTFGIKNTPVWQPFLDRYTTVDTNSSDEEIAKWFAQQNTPEQVCNMCAFTGPKNIRIEAEERSHHLKNHWKYSL